jgi:hypothetical protein
MKTVRQAVDSKTGGGGGLCRECFREFGAWINQAQAEPVRDKTAFFREFSERTNE